MCQHTQTTLSCMEQRTDHTLVNTTSQKMCYVDVLRTLKLELNIGASSVYLLYLCGFESLQLLLGYCEGRRGGTGRHVPQVSLEAEVILQTPAGKNRFKHCRNHNSHLQ